MKDIRFIPHLTLVRKVPDRREPFDLWAIEPIAWHCGKFFLVRSRLTSIGSEYLAIAEFALDNG
jgi:RNA 2',3'-cyclic 3'-phosphodiesterase